MRTLQRVRIFLLSLLVAVFAAQAACAMPFPWPDSHKHPRVMLYADDDIMNYIHDHPDWFTADFLIGGLYMSNIPYGESDAAMNKFGYIYSQLRSRGILSGTYLSGTTAVPELSLKQYPVDAVSIEDMSIKTRYLGPWMRDPVQQVVDLSDAKSNREFQATVRQLWAHIPVVMRFVDNAAVHPKVAPKMQSWATYCNNMRGLRLSAETLHGNAIFNVFVRTWEMSEDDTKQLIAAVAGNGANAVSFPIPWSKSIKDDKVANAWAIYRYRQLLDHRIVVILTPSDDAPLVDLYNWVYTWKRPTDRVYFAVPYWEIPPG